MCKKLVYLMSFVLMLAVTGTASADQRAITVPDAGFDDHVLNNVGDWIYIGDSSYTGSWKSDYGYGGAWIDYNYYAGDGDLPALSGSFKVYGYEPAETSYDYIYQILDETFIEGGTYTLSVWVGQAWSGYENGWGLYFTGENYKNNLIEASGDAPVGSWQQVSLVYTATAADAGKKVGIKMQGAAYVTFEDVTLSYAAAAIATNPIPADGATDVYRKVVLSWTPGPYVVGLSPKHNVIFSDNFDDVNDGTAVVATRDANSYDAAGLLDFSTTYYWRIDEANSTTGWDEGNVWQFTTEPIGYAIENITATAPSAHQADMGPENTINGSGLDDNDLHSNEETDMWLSGTEPLGAWIGYEFDKVYKLHQMSVWNSNQTVEPLLGFGLKDVTIEYSTNGTDYTTLATTHEFARAPGMPGYAHNTTIDFGGVAAKYVRLTATSNWGGIMPQYGLSEVRFLHIPVNARKPYPDSGATGVEPDVVLGWRAGREAVTHDVYLSTDEQAVIDGTAPVATGTEARHGPLSLDLDVTHYWRVDEVNEAETPAIWQGEIWSFTIADFIAVDDFESYNDLDPAEPESKRIFNVWIDGYGIATNGSLVGSVDPPFAEQSIVHGGEQSMPFFYSNTGGAASSEAELTLTPAQDWTAAQVRTLSVYFHGTAGNTGQLYVKINGTKVPYDGQASNLALTGWQAWNIDLASSGASLQNVTKLAIGVDGNGASGTLYFDDIGLYARGREFITPFEPDDTRLIGHWKFDGDTQDSSGRGNHGTSGVTPAVFVAGKVGSNAMDFRGADYVVIDGVVDDITSTHGSKPRRPMRATCLQLMPPVAVTPSCLALQVAIHL
ncbi:MAG: discoidin domain-containing protein [Planctomycetota bacterium]|jgi:hypothetical protein